jgi:hypothetical protein
MDSSLDMVFSWAIVAAGVGFAVSVLWLLASTDSKRGAGILMGLSSVLYLAGGAAGAAVRVQAGPPVAATEPSEREVPADVAPTRAIEPIEAQPVEDAEPPVAEAAELQAGSTGTLGETDGAATPEVTPPKKKVSPKRRAKKRRKAKKSPPPASKATDPPAGVDSDDGAGTPKTPSGYEDPAAPKAAPKTPPKDQPKVPDGYGDAPPSKDDLKGGD